MDDSSVITYVRESEVLRQEKTLHAFIQDLAELGFYVAGDDRREVGALWMAILNGEKPESAALNPETIFTPGTSLALWNDVEAFVTNRADVLSLYLYSTERAGDLAAFEATIFLEPKDHTITMSYLAKQELAPFLRWLDMLRLTYETWQPLYSYKENGETITTYEDVLAGHITTLYEINLWDSNTVEKLGRTRVMQVSTWRTVELKDGSILLIPRLIGMGGEDKDYDYDPQEIASTLGLTADF